MSRTIKAIERHLTLRSTINSGPRARKLVAEWQRGPETFLGQAQRKLRLAFVPAHP